MNIEVRPYFAEGEMYPALIGVRAEGDEYETAYVSKSELVDALAENAKLLELLQRTWDAFHDATAREFVKVKNELRELGIEVDG